MNPRPTAFSPLPVRSSIEITTQQIARPTTAPRPTVLVVDCDEVFIQLVRHALLPDYQILSAHDLTETLRVARRGRFDLIMLDLSAPFVDGVQLLEKLRSHPHLSGIPVLGFSTSRELRRRLSEADTIGVIPRTRWLDDLRHTLAETVRLSSAQTGVPLPTVSELDRAAAPRRQARVR